MISPTWEDLNINTGLCDICRKLGWELPTLIQKLAIPPALEGKDIIGLAETGSGKTAAFIIPIIQSVMSNSEEDQNVSLNPFFAVVLTPTRELASQIKEQFWALGKAFGLRTTCLIGGQHNMDKEKEILARRIHHVLVATPGRLVDHLKDTKGFDLKMTRFLVLDEADRLLSREYDNDLEVIMQCIPRDKRRTFMFSATMTNKVRKLEKACLTNAVKVNANERQKTVDNLSQFVLPTCYEEKMQHLVCFLTLHSEQCSAFNSDKKLDIKDTEKCEEINKNMRYIIFTDTRDKTILVATTLCALGFAAIPINGRMPQPERLAALNKFRSFDRHILVATDVASRGLDMPNVDVVINYDVPVTWKVYLHRVGRTARAGKRGMALNLVTQYSLEAFMKLEKMICRKEGEKLPVYSALRSDMVKQVSKSVNDAVRFAEKETFGSGDVINSKRKRRFALTTSVMTSDLKDDFISDIKPSKCKKIKT